MDHDEPAPALSSEIYAELLDALEPPQSPVPAELASGMLSCLGMLAACAERVERESALLDPMDASSPHADFLDEEAARLAASGLRPSPSP